MVRVRLMLVTLLSLVALGAGFAPAQSVGALDWSTPLSDVRHVDPQRLANLPFSGGGLPGAGEAQLRALTTYEVGATRLFPALNDALGAYEFRTFTLRAIGTSGEVWVAADLQFLLGDCRGIVEITQPQVEYMLGQFDKQIRPTDTAYFGEPKARDGSKATLAKQVGLPADYYAGSGRDIILIDNIRDDNFYTPSQSPSYIAGFFSPAFAVALDRNIITVDAYDWPHRTGGAPPNDLNANACKSRPARPYLYEGTFAHEYQHLIHNDFDPGEDTWVNEGMADFAQSLNNYAYPERTISEIGNDGHIQSFLGFAADIVTVQGKKVPVARSGAENSLTTWGDQGDDEILADYGIAYAFMLYVDEHFGGAKFMKTWQNGPEHGISGFEKTLALLGYQTTFAQVYRDFAVAMVTDQLIDDGATGPARERYSAKALHAQVSLNTDQSFGTPGAPPWGADYVKITEPGTIGALNFTGAPNLVRKTPWTSRTSGPAGWKGGAVLWSGSANNYNAWLLREVALGEGPQTLSFDTYFDIEECFDYGFVRVSTDGGQSFTSLANDATDDCTSDDPDNTTAPAIAAERPGFTGQTGAWGKTSFDLSAYAGQTVVLAFHYAQDPGASGNDTSVSNDGWWIDNLMVNDTLLSDGTAASLRDFADITAVRPIPTTFSVQIVGVSNTRYGVTSLTLADGKVGALSAAQLAELAGHDYIVAIVSYDAPLDPQRGRTVTDYAPYALTITRGGEPILLPGGGQLPTP